MLISQPTGSFGAGTVRNGIGTGLPRAIERRTAKIRQVPTGNRDTIGRSPVSGREVIDHRRREKDSEPAGSGKRRSIPWRLGGKRAGEDNEPSSKWRVISGASFRG